MGKADNTGSQGRYLRSSSRAAMALAITSLGIGSPGGEEGEYCDPRMTAIQEEHLPDRGSYPWPYLSL